MATTTEPTLQSRRTRLLLALWTLGYTGEEMKRGDVNSKAKRKGEKSADYQELWQELEEKQVVTTIPERKRIKIDQNSTSQLLIAALQDPEFAFKGTVMGIKKVNALLALFRSQGITESLSNSNTLSQNGSVLITSYDEFKSLAIETYDRLKRDYNFGNMVPIYRIRREIGDRIARSQFSDWLFEMQDEDLFQLLESGVEDNALDKLEDSVTTQLGDLRCYAKKLVA